MFIRRLSLGLLAFALTSSPLSLFSQDAQPQADQLQEWLVEINYLRSQLAPIEDRALVEPDIAQQQTTVSETVLAAMTEADSTVVSKLERLRAIVAEAGAANGDQARMDALSAEAHALQPAIERAQSLALERPEIAAQVAAFRQAVCDRMAELAPESKDMITRYQELQRLIHSSLRQGSSPPPMIGR